jgi:hypothetical protein
VTAATQSELPAAPTRAHSAKPQHRQHADWPESKHGRYQLMGETQAAVLSRGAVMGFTRGDDAHQEAGQYLRLHLLVLAAEELLVLQLAALAVDGLAPQLDELRSDAQLQRETSSVVLYCDNL